MCLTQEEDNDMAFFKKCIENCKVNFTCLIINDKGIAVELQMFP